MTKRHSSARTVALFICISLLIVGLFACDDQKDGSSAHSGKLSLNLDADTTSLKKGVNSNLTKAVSDEFAKFLTVGDYHICIVTDKDTVKSYDRFDKMPSEIELPEGAYTIIASKGNNLPAEFENPYFEGSTAFTVKDGMDTRLYMTCTLGNGRITVESTDDFSKIYTDYNVDLKTVFIDSLLRIAKDEMRPAYLQVATEGTEVNITVYVKKAEDTEFTAFHVQTPLILERRQNVRLILKLSDGNQGVGLDVMLDDELTYLPIDTKIPDYMHKPMGDAKLLPSNFGDNDEKEVQPGKYKENAAVHFEMKGGVSSLVVILTKDDEDPVAFDIATVEGAAAATAKNFKWSKTNNEKDAVTDPVTNNWLEGYLFLDAAINSLQAPIIDDQTYLYKLEFSGKDATGKTHETNVLTYNIIMLSAGAPAIETNGVLPTSIVEGDLLSENVEYILEASSLIDKDATTLTINDQLYNISADAASLKQSYGIEASFDSDAKAVIVFPATFSNYLTVPTGSESKDYKFILKLKDKAGKEKLQEKVITVYAPIFTFDTDNGAAFAKRVVLHGTLTKGDPAKLSFTNNNAPVDVSEITLVGQNYQAVLTGLQPETSYTLQAIYNNNESRKSGLVSVATENVQILEDGQFENWHSEKSYSNTVLGIGIDTYQWFPYVSGGTSWWSTRNNLTNSQNSGAAYYYTSYSGTVPNDNGYVGKAAEISSLGFGNGSTCAAVGWNAKKKAAGMLFIGSHSCTNNKGELTETLNYGRPFSVRPTGFKFFYKFKSVNKESFKAFIVIENRENGKTIELGRGELVDSIDKTDFTEATVNVRYSNFELKATHMYIVFISSTAVEPSLILVKGDKGEFAGNADFRFVGNVLTVDNVELIYE